MVLVKIDKDPSFHLDENVVQALEKSLRKDLKGISCPHCDSESYVCIQIRKNKLSGISTHIHACCEDFRKKIEEILLVEHSR